VKVLDKVLPVLLAAYTDMFWPVKGGRPTIFFFRQCVGSRTDGYSTVDQSDMRGLVTA
jgi:hypothetical protein